MRTPVFALYALAVAVVLFLALRLNGNEYYFVAGYTILQYVILATAWNILGGYIGYVNFGSAAFFAAGAYSSVALITFANEIDELVPEGMAPFFHSIFPLPIPVLIVIGGLVSGLIGYGTGYLTLRLRGAFFAIATLALAVVLETLVVNWEFVGGSSGAYVIRPSEAPLAPLVGTYVQYLFILMLLMAVGAVTVARAIERSKLGYGFAAIRDDELAAEASGVPTLNLKLVATALSGALMGMAGAPFPYFIGFLQPISAFGLEYAVNSIAMPMIGGTMSWVGPLIGAVLLGTLQQVANVTISSAVNLLIVGLLLIGFVIVAPNGIVGLYQDWTRSTEEAMNALLQVKGVGKKFGGFVALDGIDLDVQAGERLGLIGPNGSGKSTLVNCICGTLQNEVGSVHFDGHAMNGLAAHERTHRGLARSFQLPRPFTSLTLADNLKIPMFYTVHKRSGTPLHADNIDARCSELLQLVGLDAKAQQRPRDLTQVEMRKLELARAMAAEPKLLIADEAMAGLSHSEIEEILALLKRLNETGITIILIEHIMSAVMSFSQRLVVLVTGKKIADGAPETVVRDPEVVRAYIGE